MTAEIWVPVKIEEISLALQEKVREEFQGRRLDEKTYEVRVPPSSDSDRLRRLSERCVEYGCRLNLNGWFHNVLPETERPLKIE